MPSSAPAKAAGASRWSRLATAAAVGIFGLFEPLAVNGAEVELSGFVGIEGRGFLHSPLNPRQERNSASVVAQPEFYFEWDDGRQSFVLVPFARVDSADSERTHADLREALWLKVGDGWELRVGLGKVFWGVTESRHLVDIINQTDLVEDIDGEDKLGQPMVNLSLIQDWGTVDLFVLPGFRERTFPGVKGRLRTMPPVDTGGAVYQSGAERTHVDLAARWSHVMGDWDVGLSHFWGTSRDPVLVPVVANPLGSNVPPTKLVPRYDIIHQTGLDLQATIDNWLWKLETAYRSGQGESFVSAVGGFEYTFVGAFETAADVGVLAEYLYDERGDDSTQPFEDDLFVGLRLTLNDAPSTEVLTGFIQDLDGDSTVFNLEASRRFGDHWLLEIEARGWSGVSANDPLHGLRRDDYVQMTLSRFF